MQKKKKREKFHAEFLFGSPIVPNSWDKVRHKFNLLFFLLTLSFDIISDFQKGCKESAKNFCVHFLWSPQMLTFCNICYVILSIQIDFDKQMHTVFVSSVGELVAGMMVFPLLLNTLIFSLKDMLVYSHSAMIKIRKLTLIQYYYLICWFILTLLLAPVNALASKRKP